MEIDLQIAGFDEFIERMESSALIYEEEVAVAMADAVRDLEAGLLMTAPYGIRDPHIKSSITREVKAGGTRIVGTVHVGPHWASWVDKGTKAHKIPMPNGVVIDHPGAKPARFVAAAKRLEQGEIEAEFEQATHRIAARLDGER